MKKQFKIILIVILIIIIFIVGFVIIKKNNEILTSINGELNIFSACINAILMAFTLVYIKNFLKSKTNQR